MRKERQTAEEWFGGRVTQRIPKFVQVYSRGAVMMQEGSCRLCCACRPVSVQKRIAGFKAFNCVCSNHLQTNNIHRTWTSFPTLSAFRYFAICWKKFNPHQVEPARSDRSLCQKKSKKDPCVFEGNKIEKGHLRIGSLNEKHDTFSWFVHLEVRWRIVAECLFYLRLFPFSRKSILAFSVLACSRKNLALLWRIRGIFRSKIENSLLALMSGYADLSVLQKQVQHISTDLPIFEVHCGFFRR